MEQEKAEMEAGYSEAQSTIQQLQTALSDLQGQLQSTQLELEQRKTGTSGQYSTDSIAYQSELHDAHAK